MTKKTISIGLDRTTLVMVKDRTRNLKIAEKKTSILTPHYRRTIKEEKQLKDINNRQRMYEFITIIDL